MQINSAMIPTAQLALADRKRRGKVEVTYEKYAQRINGETTDHPRSPIRIPAIIKTIIAVKPNNMLAPCVSTFATSP